MIALKLGILAAVLSLSNGGTGHTSDVKGNLSTRPAAAAAGIPYHIDVAVLHRAAVGIIEGDQVGIRFFNVEKRLKADDQRRRIKTLETFNHWRKSTEPAATNMIRLTWSVLLEIGAFKTAEKCSVRSNHKGGSFRVAQHTMPLVGSMDGAIEDFYNETPKFQLDRDDCDPKLHCGFDKEVVRASNTHVGCSTVVCSATKHPETVRNSFYNFVCRFQTRPTPKDEPVVPDGKPYETGGARASRCPTSHPKSEDGLCTKQINCADLEDCQENINTTTCLCDQNFYARAMLRLKHITQDMDDTEDVTFPLPDGSQMNFTSLSVLMDRRVLPTSDPSDDSVTLQVRRLCLLAASVVTLFTIWNGPL